MDSPIVDLAANPAEKVSGLDPAKFVVSIQLLDYSTFECKLPSVDCLLPWRGRDGKYHSEESSVPLARTPCMTTFCPSSQSSRLSGASSALS